MTTQTSDWFGTLTRLLVLAAALEGDGQYNLAKLARAAADALSRQTACRIELPKGTDELAAEVMRTAAALSRLNASEALVSALEQGAGVMAVGGLPPFSLIPHPYGCRTCGHLTLAEPAVNCPTCGAWPGTYQRFMPNYWFDALEPPAALAQLQQTPIAVADLLAGISETRLNQPPSDGGWSMRNILAHLGDAEGVLSFRLDLFLHQENPILESKAVFAWAQDEGERPATAHAVFAAYQASRRVTIGKLEQLPLANWWRTGRHEEFGIMSLQQQVSYFAAHEVTHLSQLGALRREWLTGR